MSKEGQDRVEDLADLLEDRDVTRGTLMSRRTEVRGQDAEVAERLVEEAIQQGSLESVRNQPSLLRASDYHADKEGPSDRARRREATTPIPHHVF